MAQKKKQGERTPTQILFEDATQTLGTDAAELDLFASSVAAMTAGPDPIFSPVSLLKACERAADGAGLLIARALERLGPSTKRAADVARRIEAAVDPAQRALIDDLGTIEPYRAFAVTDPHHDTSTVYLQGRRPGGQEVGAHFFSEAGFGGAATAFDPKAPAEQTYGRAASHPDVILDELSLAQARAWLEHALAMRDEAYEADLDDNDDLIAAEQLPIVVHYFRQCPPGGELPEQARLTTDDEVAGLIHDFLTSPFAAGVDGAAEWAGQLAEFGMAVSRRPLWWSPTTAEIFGQYVLHMLRPERPETLLPVTKAWARWAGARLGKRDAAINDTVTTIDQIMAQVAQEPAHVVSPPGLAPTEGGAWYNNDWLDEQANEAWAAHEANVAAFVRTSLKDHQGTAIPATAADAAATIRRGVRDQRWPYSALAELGEPAAPSLDETTDGDVVLWAASATIDPDLDQIGDGPITDHSKPLSRAGALESVDWATIIVAVVQAGPGAFCGVDRLTEILMATAEVGDDDIDLVGASFEHNRPLWQAAGITDADDRLTELGVWALPRAVCRVLATEFD